MFLHSFNIHGETRILFSAATFLSCISIYYFFSLLGEIHQDQLWCQWIHCWSEHWNLHPFKHAPDILSHALWRRKVSFTNQRQSSRLILQIYLEKHNMAAWDYLNCVKIVFDKAFCCAWWWKEMRNYSHYCEVHRQHRVCSLASVLLFCCGYFCTFVLNWDVVRSAGEVSSHQTS